MSSNLERTELLIAGIGASAGGVEALGELFENLSLEPPMALIVIQHSDPAHPTLLPEILSKRTKLEVVLAKEGQPLKAGVAYVCPPDAFIEIAENRIHLVDREKNQSINLPIDHFFRALANHSKESAIAIVLSGSGSDGALGLQEIKANGGITFAQSDPSAKFHGMPHSAIYTGSVDFVLTPAEIARELQKIGHHEYVRHRSRETFEVAEGTSDEVKEILKLVHRVAGMDFSQYKHHTISRRISRRVALHNVRDLTSYIAILKERPEEVKLLSQDLLIQVTKFFRDGEVFRLLKEKVFPLLMKGREKEDQLRIWVPGCSSGEEIYSVLISLSEYLEETNQRVPIQAFGTDIGESALNKARLASYIENIAIDVDSLRLRRFFTKVGATYEVNKSLRDLCIFAKHNFLTDPPFGKLDLITCRNVLIYLEPALQRRVLSIFHYALKPNGVLVLGNAESLGSSVDSFAAIDSRYRIYAKKPTNNRMYFDFAGTQYAASRITAPSTSAPPGDDVTRGLQFQREADRILLAEFIPAGVIVDERLEVVQFRGHTGAYLEHTPGFASFGLLKMLREGLITEVKKAIETARAEEKRVRKENLRTKTNGDSRRVAVEVIPARLPPSGDRFFLVLFEDMDVPEYKASKRRREIKDAARKIQDDTVEIAALRAELASTKEFLQSINEEREAANEELKASNEEIMSSNEELQSMNEELHTAKEELQSTNEELMTLNDELQSRNRDLSHLSDDLTNLFNSMNAAVILLNKDLRIRKYTPLAEKLLRLIPADIGRPVTDIRPNLDIPDLEKILLEVVETVSPKTLETRDPLGRWYSVQFRPYRTNDNRINGVVLLLTDINELKSSLIFSQALENVISHPLLILGGDLAVKRANKKFYEVFEVDPKDTENRYLYQLCNGQWDVPELRKLLEEILPRSAEFSDFKITHRFTKLGTRTMSLSGRRLFYDAKSTETILLSIELLEEEKKV